MIGPRTTAAAIAFLAAIPAAGAQGQSGLVSMKVLLPSEDDPEELIEVTNPVDLRRFFNQARCECGDEFGVELFSQNPDVAAGEQVEIWVGNNCDDIELRDMFCSRVAVVPDVRDLRNRRIELISVRDLAAPITGECPAEEINPRVYAMVDVEGDGIFEYVDTLEVFLDLRPPPPPVEVEARGSEAGLIVDWELGESRIDDFEFFQVLCFQEDDPATPVFDDPDPPEYLTAQNLCGIGGAATPLPGGLDAGLPDAGAPDAGGGTSIDLDPAFICDTSTFGATSMSVDGLENGVRYRVVWVGIDPSRNPTAVELGVVEPEPLTDYWEDYKNSGGGADGGYCFVATATFGSYDHPYVVVLRDFRDGTLAKFGLGRWLIETYYALSPPLARAVAGNSVLRGASMVLLFPVVGAAAIWEYTGWLAKLALALALALAVRLRRMRRQRRGAPARPRRASSPRRRIATAAAAGAVLVLAAMGSASAQTWFEELEETSSAEPSPEDVKWNFELKLGPYVPSADDEFEGEGPFERMFGDGPFLITQMTLERFFLWPEGQLGISAGVGYLSKGADAFRVDDQGQIEMDPETGEPLRAEGATTTFRLVPTNLSAVYRLTTLDDRFRIPVVPYGRLGLSYYLWWVTRPDGKVSSVEGNKARGGSLGWQGSVGLALRAERIDPEAGVNLRNNLGIAHAGFFAELTLADVDGFGAEDKLSVGDLFWSAGINFEF